MMTKLLTNGVKLTKIDTMKTFRNQRHEHGKHTRYCSSNEHLQHVHQ